MATGGRFSISGKTDSWIGICWTFSIRNFSSATLTYEAFEFDFNVVVCQVVDFFDRWFDNGSIEYAKFWILTAFNAEKFSKRFRVE